MLSSWSLVSHQKHEISVSDRSLLDRARKYLTIVSVGVFQTFLILSLAGYWRRRYNDVEKVTLLQMMKGNVNNAVPTSAARAIAHKCPTSAALLMRETHTTV